jgi:pimeloyl-ACP methyl ester carboxylesterase/DNA-binding winged helix-turn-helix (wHTH) protein
MHPETPLAFHEFRLDPGRGQLCRSGTPIPLTPKAFALLGCLAQASGRLVSKQELLDSVWSGVFVGDAVLKSTIRELRKALGDNADAPRFIETAHRRGYRFIAPVTTEPAVRAEAAAGPVHALGAVAVAAVPRVHYAHSGSVNIAYQVVGEGSIDLVFVMGWVSHLEYFWKEPAFARFLDRLASMGRLILFDKRGTGLSDPVPVAELPTLEQRLDDVRAVMEAAGSEHAVLLGVSEGGPLCSLFAATYPEKTDALIMVGSYARRIRDDQYPWGPTREERDAFCQAILDQWGGPVGIEERAPSKASDPAFREWWASYLRMGSSPGAAVALTQMNAQIDIRAVLPSIRVPTLVLHRRGDRCLKVEEGRFLASHIPGARFIELPGEDHLPFLGDQDEILDEIEGFVSRARVRTSSERVLATVLTVMSAARAEDAAHIGRVFAREVAWHRGRAVALDDRRLVAMFDGPGRAVQCGTAIAVVAQRSSIPVRGGVHIGECDPTSASGPVQDVSAALASAGASGEVLVSRTVVDLLPGSGLQFGARGAVQAGERWYEVMGVAAHQG